MADQKPVIGVLALQGAVEPHRPHIEKSGGVFRPVKTPDDFEKVDGFILPGGESTTMLNLIRTFDLWDALATHFRTKPVWGICAGCILLAESVLNPDQDSFGLLPISVERNGYGRQLNSHHDDIDGYTVSFIRAPVITSVRDKAEILATHKGHPVWVRKGNIMASTFHPELTMNFPSPMHQAFIDMVRKSA